jgi:hypothetical protein
MKSTVFAATILALTSAASAEPIAEPLRTNLIAGWVKYCQGTFNNSGIKKSWTDQEISDFCNCGSVTMADRTTQEMYDARQKQGDYPKEWWTMREEVRVYCTDKYVKYPDVTGIKNRKW